MQVFGEIFQRLTRLTLFLTLVYALGGLPALALAQEPSLDDINRVAKQLSCPTCAGINVADCPTETCAQWRAKIGELLAEGKTDQEILEYFAARYGDHVLQMPPTRGVFLSIWVVPVLAILAGLGLLGYLVRRWTGASAAMVASVTSNEELQDEYLKRVEQELSMWRE